MRILVLDDQPAWAGVLVGLCQAEGLSGHEFEAVQFADLARALRLDDWDMALVDIQLEDWHAASPGRLNAQKTGLDALDLIAGESPDLPVFVHTATDVFDRVLFQHAAFWIHTGSRPMFKQARLLGVLDKPPRPDRLARCLTAGLHGMIDPAANELGGGTLLGALLGNQFDLGFWQGLGDGVTTSPALAGYTGAGGSTVNYLATKMTRVLIDHRLVHDDGLTHDTFKSCVPMLLQFAQTNRPFFFSKHAAQIHAALPLLKRSRP